VHTVPEKFRLAGAPPWEFLQGATRTRQEFKCPPLGGATPRIGAKAAVRRSQGLRPCATNTQQPSRASHHSSLFCASLRQSSNARWCSTHRRAVEHPGFHSVKHCMQRGSTRMGSAHGLNVVSREDSR